MANGVNLVLVCFVSSDPRSEARDQPIQVVVEIHKKVIDSELEKKSDVLLPLMASYLAGYAALVAAASKRLAIAAGPLTWLSYAWLSIETWAILLEMVSAHGLSNQEIRDTRHPRLSAVS